MHIFKFGGASVKNAEGIKNVLQIIELHKKDQLLIIVSAIGQTTDKLEELLKSFFRRHGTHLQLFDEIKQFHFHLLDELCEDKNHPNLDHVLNTFVGIYCIIARD